MYVTQDHSGPYKITQLGTSLVIQWSRLQASNGRGVERSLVGQLRLFEPEIRQVVSRRELTEEEGEEEKGPGK